MKITHHKGRIWRVMSTVKKSDKSYVTNRQAVVVAPTAQIAIEAALKAAPDAVIISCNPVTSFHELDIISCEEETK